MQEEALLQMNYLQDLSNTNMSRVAITDNFTHS